MSQDKERVRDMPNNLEMIVENIDLEQVISNIYSLMKEGKRITEFSADDWMMVIGLDGSELVWDAVEDKLKVAFKNEISPGQTAENLMAAMKRVKALYGQFKAGEISETDFLYESEWACLDSVVMILASYLQSKPIEAKAIGIVINDEIFKLRYDALKSTIRGEWEETLARLAEEQRALDAELDKKYANYIEWLEKDLKTYRELLQRAFSDDLEEALAGSVELGSFMKLPRAELLGTIDEIDDYFL